MVVRPSGGWACQSRSPAIQRCVHVNDERQDKAHAVIVHEVGAASFGNSEQVKICQEVFAEEAGFELCKIFFPLEMKEHDDILIRG